MSRNWTVGWRQHARGRSRNRQRLERPELYLKDNRGAWEMQSDGSFIQRQPGDGKTL